MKTKKCKNPLGAKNNDSTSQKWVIVIFYTMEYRKCGNFNSKNDSRLRVGASAFLKCVDFMAFAVNVKTIAPTQKLYQYGHAIWWGDMPMAMYTFLEEYDWNGKTIIPFVTHAGSGMSDMADNIRDICIGADVLNGFAITGETVQNDAETKQDEISEWLEELDMQ